MASYTKRGRKTYAQVRLLGVSEGQSFDTKAQAVAWATLREQEIRDGAAGKAPRKSLADAVQRFKEEVLPGHSSGRMAGYRLDAMLNPKRGKARLPGARQLASITVADLTEWKDQRLREVSAASVLREFTVLQSLFEYARRDWRWINSNPARDVRKPGKPASRKHVISDEQRDKLLLALGYVEGERQERPSAQVGAMLLLALETGMRAGEIASLTWDRVHVAARFAQLDKTKNGDSRQVPLSKRAVQLLEAQRGLDDERVFTISNDSRDVLFRKARDRCKLALNFHDARHTAATRIGRAGKLSVLEFCAMFGWRDPRMAMVYFNPTATQLADRLD